MPDSYVLFIYKQHYKKAKHTVKANIFSTCSLMSVRFCILMEYLTFKRKLTLMLYKFSMSFYFCF